MARPDKKRIAKRIGDVAKRGIKKIGKSRSLFKKKTTKKTKAALGLGSAPKRIREATRKDILRKGVSLLKRNNATLARFIALRYGAKAIAKYQNYAGRLRRSIRLRKQVVKIDDATFRIKGYVIRTDTQGNNPYSCTCPDFSQFSNDNRNWLSSKAGPFNPCKHMMAVRDRQKGKWICNNGVCTINPLAVNGYATKAECEAALVPANFSGGQCFKPYHVTVFYDAIFLPTGDNYPDTLSGIVDGPIDSIGAGLIYHQAGDYPPSFGAAYCVWIRAMIYGSPVYYRSADFNSNQVALSVTDVTVTALDGIDNCGDPPKKCPI